MATAVQRALRATTYERPPTSLTADLVEYERFERLRRAAAVFTPLFGAALLSLFVPGWHFVGVPGFLILAIVLGRRRLVEVTALESLQGTCPSCAERQHFAPPSSFDLPATLRCPGCSAFVKLEAP